jgi:hypothetical protein
MHSIYFPEWNINNQLRPAQVEKTRKNNDGVEESLLLPVLLGYEDNLPALICDDKTDSLLSYRWL